MEVKIFRPHSTNIASHVSLPLSENYIDNFVLERCGSEKNPEKISSSHRRLSFIVAACTERIQNILSSRISAKDLLHIAGNVRASSMSDPIFVAQSRCSDSTARVMFVKPQRERKSTRRNEEIFQCKHLSHFLISHLRPALVL